MCELSPLDLPQIHEQPSPSVLITTLQSLELQPPVWNLRRHSDMLAEQESLASARKADMTPYLVTIIQSPLSWIEDDDEKERIWDLASKRISERGGRSGMGEIIRKWPFEAEDGTPSYEPFELVIREPALTGDSLGFKTWGSSYVLANHLPQLAATSLAELFDRPEVPTVLELGSGTGLLGLAAAALWKLHVVLSDLPSIVENLESNAERNREAIEARGGGASVGALTWGGSEDEVDQELFGRPSQFKIVLVADPMYDDDHPVLLASAISQHLALCARSRAVVMVPRRDATTVKLLHAFKQAMLDLEEPLVCGEEDELAGQDDWVDDDEGGRVQCWLGVFSRRAAST
ncbi:Protein-lysine N-methyltransferase rrg1 [Conoideocrella luteorostrata]|uniref:Protein-lysine N-methyltransferase rrg1 n=1 Tax=Conoideocrella luteorostrata TaxID=1105319 RepID=A0AAJ0CG73_9HYPO|nr:Protein-lysine N-methyltransferase rrg1 [Conoideocrella luteorostrata]